MYVLPCYLLHSPTVSSIPTLLWLTHHAGIPNPPPTCRERSPHPHRLHNPLRLRPALLHLLPQLLHLCPTPLHSRPRILWLHNRHGLLRKPSLFLRRKPIIPGPPCRRGSCGDRARPPMPDMHPLPLRALQSLSHPAFPL